MVNQAQMATAAQLAEFAKELGLETAQAVAVFADASKTRRDALTSARDSVEQDKQLDGDKGVQAFNAPRIKNLARLGQRFGTLFNDPDSKAAKESARMGAATYMTNATGRSEASLNGGVLGNYSYVILCGAQADRVRRALQDRLDHWQARKVAAAAMTDAEERKNALAECMRYLQPAGQGPGPDGKPLVDEKGGIKTPKHMGRPAKKVNGIKIERGGATNRDSQLGQFAKMFLHHGDAVLTDEFVDAWLDNGGKWEGAGDTPESLASAALATIEKLLLAGGATSADSANLTAMRMFLTRIATEGLAKNAPAEVAQSPAPAAPAVPAPEPVVKVGDETQVDVPDSVNLDESINNLLAAPVEPVPATENNDKPAPSRKVRRAAVTNTRPGM